MVKFMYCKDFAKYIKCYKKESSSKVQPTINEPASNSSAKVVLSKAKLGLDHHIVRLKKEKNIDLSNHRARVFVVMDRSSSMKFGPLGDLYCNGYVQAVLTRLLPLALRFDDNGELEVYVFNTKCTQLLAMNLNNYETYVDHVIMRNNYGPSGGTNYSPVIEQTISDYNDGSPYPAFGIIVTDGDANDKDATNNAIRKSSEYKMFYQFVGIGSENFKYLEKLDDLDGRKVDNTAFIKVSDFSQLDDEQLYAKLLEQYLEWLRAMNII